LELEGLSNQKFVFWSNFNKAVVEQRKQNS